MILCRWQWPPTGQVVLPASQLLKLVRLVGANLGLDGLLAVEFDWTNLHMHRLIERLWLAIVVLDHEVVENAQVAIFLRRHLTLQPRGRVGRQRLHDRVICVRHTLRPSFKVRRRALIHVRRVTRSALLHM